MKEIIISHNCIPPTVLIIREFSYSLKFGRYEVPFGQKEAEKLIAAIKANPINL